MTTKKNKKQLKKEHEENVATIVNTIIGVAVSALVIYLVLFFPTEFAALFLFAAVGATSERWSHWAMLGKMARERTEPDR